MLIDFDKLEETVLPNFYAGNKKPLRICLQTAKIKSCAASLYRGRLLVCTPMKSAVKLFIFTRLRQSALRREI